MIKRHTLRRRHGRRQLEALERRVLLASPFVYTGTGGADNYLVRPKAGSPGTIEVLRNSAIIDTQLASNVSSMTFNAQAGNDTLTVTTSTTPVIFNGGTTASDHDVLNLNAGSYVFSTDAITTTAHLTINVNAATLALATAQHLESLNIAASGVVSAAQGGRSAVRTDGLSIAGGGKLDLNDNDLVVASGNFSALQALVFQGYSATPDPTKTGIVSTRSQNDGGASVLALFNNALETQPDYPFGNGEAVSPTAIIGKYTFVGDCNWDDQVTQQDYTAIDANFGSSGVDPGIAWFYGDTNFDDNVTPQDYTGIDAALGLRKPIPPVELVQHAADGLEASNTTKISLAFPTSNVAGDFLIVTGTAARSAQNMTISDTAGDTFVAALGPVNDPAQSVTAYIWYVARAKGGANTVTLTPTDGAGHALEIHISEWAGMNSASPVDQTSWATGNGTQISSGTKTPTQNGELIFGYTFPNQNAIAGAGFTGISLINGDLDEYQIQNAAGPVAATYTQASDNWLALMVTFRPV